MSELRGIARCGWTHRAEFSSSMTLKVQAPLLATTAPRPEGYARAVRAATRRRRAGRVLVTHTLGMAMRAPRHKRRGRPRLVPHPLG